VCIFGSASSQDKGTDLTNKRSKGKYSKSQKILSNNNDKTERINVALGMPQTLYHLGG
jgi:hypothetical protein